MNEIKTIALIPARYDSTRFRGKMMALLKGIPVIRRTYEATAAMQLFSDVIVVTDNTEIYDEIVSHGGKAMMSEKHHESGSDRIAEAAQKLTHISNTDIIVNVQGDEPFTKRESVELLLKAFKNDIQCRVRVASLMQKLENEEHIASDNYVKVVVDKYSNALYFSRSVIPRSKKCSTNYYEHIGVYAFRKEALLEFSTLPKGYLEERESVECLRYLEYGIPIKMVVTNYMGIEIDTPEDLANAEKLL
jgi:3-deoxy-D-manno-octulosonate cytidylyltransferase